MPLIGDPLHVGRGCAAMDRNRCSSAPPLRSGSARVCRQLRWVLAPGEHQSAYQVMVCGWLAQERSLAVSAVCDSMIGQEVYLALP